MIVHQPSKLKTAAKLNGMSNREYLLQLLNHGDIYSTALALGVEIRQVYSLIKKHQIIKDVKVTWK